MSTEDPEPMEEATVVAPSDAPAGKAAGPRVAIDSVATGVIERLAARGALADRYAAPGGPSVPQELGRGGMAVVRRVWDEDLRRQLAMKVMHGSEGVGSGTSDVDPQRVRRFLEEAQVTAQLDHPGVVPVHELGLDERGRLFFTMRLVSGRELGMIFALARQERDGWSRARALSAVQRVCETMAFAHERGVIHRDLKPSNIMVGRFGETYVMDWGLAKVLAVEGGAPEGAPRSSLRADANDAAALATTDGSVLGTPAYMPPEQAAGEISAMGPRSDVYSVGAILYHLLSGHPPFLGAGESTKASAVLVRLLSGPPPPVESLAPDVPPELAAICERAMARAPERRYADMGEMADDLRAYLEGRVVRAYETGAVAEFRKWVVRNRGMAASLAAAVVLAFAGLGSTSWVQARSNRELASKNAALARAERIASENAARANAAAVRASESAALAEASGAEALREKERVLRLSDQGRVSELRARVEDLYPARPSIVGRLERWVEEARALCDRLPLHRATLDALRERALAPDAPGPLGPLDGGPYAEELDDLRRRLEAHRAVLAEGAWLGGIEAGTIEVRIGELEGSIRSLEADAAAVVPWRFASVPEQWEHDQLAQLVDALEDLVRAGGLLSQVERRLAFARTIEERSVTGSEAAARWAEATGSIADADECPAYGGLRIEPQLGLLPIGRDAESGLWEFVDLATGADPLAEGGAGRDARGRLVLSEATGVVFVLLPGAELVMGAVQPGAGFAIGEPHVDPGALVNEQPLHPIRLDPFFIGKYELTQGQWLRFTGEMPSVFHPGFDWSHPFTLLHPVESVTWRTASLVLEHMGFELPTEAQWEYAARGGTTTPFWTGEDPRSIEGAGNLNDINTIGVIDQPETAEIETWLDDGYGVHAPVGSYRANPFGLHDVIGNVGEWCADATGFYDMPVRPGTGRRFESELPFRILRGSSWQDAAHYCRSAVRFQGTENEKSETLGIRAARRLDRRE